MSTPRQRVFALVAEHDLDLYDDSDGDVTHITIYTPRGRVFAANNDHSVTMWRHGDRPGVWPLLLDDLAAGVVACTTDRCDHCEEES